MQCPKCDMPLEAVRYLEIEVDRCTGCEGIWFDALEKEKLAAMSGSEEIDTGDPKVGRQYNDRKLANCPRCRVAMLRMIDPIQKHIWFEHCAVCGGAWFDAGEFTDFKEHTLSDFFKGLIRKKRD